MITGPWFLTPTAIRDYLAIRRNPDVSDGPIWERACRELHEVSTHAVSSGRQPSPWESGALCYRGPKPGRVPGRQPQLVRVLPAHDGLRR